MCGSSRAGAAAGGFDGGLRRYPASQYALLISVDHGFAPFMIIPAAAAGVSPPSAMCRLMQL